MFSPQYTDAIAHKQSSGNARGPKWIPVSRKKQVHVLLAMFLAVISIPCIALYNFGRSWGFVSAAETGDIAKVRSDLDWGMDPNTKGKGLPAIAAAAGYGHPAIVQLLLDRGANPSDGLLLAVRKNQADIVALLIRRGASVNQRPGYSISPLGEAEEDGNKRIAQILWQAGAKE